MRAPRTRRVVERIATTVVVIGVFTPAGKRCRKEPISRVSARTGSALALMRWLVNSR
jgi:hypothetical protein